MACCLFVLWKKDHHHSFFSRKRRKNLHTHRNSITQRESNTLRLATDADVASDSACFRSLHADWPMHPRLQGVFFVKKKFVPRKKKQNIPKRLRAYMFADRKSHLPEVAPSGVRHDIFVAFMTCFRYSRGSLSDLEVNERSKMTMRHMVTHDTGLLTLTRFSHSNSVHILRNYIRNR